MEYQEEQSSATRHGEFAETDMGVVMNATAFRILMSGIYSKKEEAIIRELMCNAKDSHVSAGQTERKIELYLPNKNAPFFKIRDYGTGLSDSGMRNVFGGFFNSTKRGDNDQIGCFGLGSKSPFALTDMYTAVSYYEGFKRVYSCFLEDGKPKIALMHKEETTEPSGLEVNFPVTEWNMWDDFARAARNVLRPFNTDDYVIFGRAIDVQDYKVLEHGEGWAIFDDGDAYHKRLVVRMGNVDYPVESEQLYNKLPSHCQFVTRLNLMVHMPLGSVQPAASRESLEMNDITLPALVAKFTKIGEEMLTHLQQRIEEQPNRREAIRYYWNAAGSSSAPLHCLKAQVKQEWRGMPLRLAIRPALYGLRLTGIVQYGRWSKGQHVNAVREEPHDILPLYNDKLVNNIVFVRNSKEKRLVMSSVRFTAEDILIIEPVVKLNVARHTLINEWSHGEHFKIAAALQDIGQGDFMSDPTGKFDETLDLSFCKEKWDLFRRHTGIGWKMLKSPYDLEQEPEEDRIKKTPVRAPRDRGDVYFLTSRRESNADCWTAQHNFDLTDGGVYADMAWFRIKMYKGALADPSNLKDGEKSWFMAPRDMKRVWDNLNAAMGTNIPLIGVSKDPVIRKMKKLGNWIHVEDYILQCFQKMSQDMDLMKAVCYWQSKVMEAKEARHWDRDADAYVYSKVHEPTPDDRMTHHRNTVDMLLTRRKTALDVLPWNYEGPLREFCEEYLHYEPYQGRIKYYTRLAEFVEAHYYSLAPMKWPFAVIQEAYPMLAADLDDVDGQLVADYIKLIDKHRTCNC